jgi:hypothetical protein
MLESKIKHLWVDPRKVHDKDDFFYEYCLAWGLSTAASEILSFVHEMEGKRDALLAKKEGKVVNNFKIGG